MASLHYIHAPMNSSKSAQLLMTLYNYEERGMNVLIVKPAIDTRDSVYVRSRALRIKRKADIALHRGDTNVVYDRVSEMFKDESCQELYYDVVLVDEAQFFTKEQIDELGDIVDDFKIPVMAYGLRTDFNGNLFEGSKRLFEIAEKFQEFKTICPCCGKKAIINLRLDDDNETPVFHGDQVKPGTNYLPICRRYYKELKEKYEGE